MEKKVVVIVKSLSQPLMDQIIKFPESHSSFFSGGSQFTFDIFPSGKPNSALLKRMFVHASYSAIKNSKQEDGNSEMKFMIFSSYFDGEKYTKLSSFGTPISCKFDGGSHMSVEDEFRKFLHEFSSEIEMMEK